MQYVTPCKEPEMFTPLSAQLAAAKTDDVVRNRRYWTRGHQDDVKPDDRPDGGARGARGGADRRGGGAPAARLRRGWVGGGEAPDPRRGRPPRQVGGRPPPLGRLRR